MSSENQLLFDESTDNNIAAHFWLTVTDILRHPTAVGE